MFGSIMALVMLLLAIFSPVLIPLTATLLHHKNKDGRGQLIT